MRTPPPASDASAPELSTDISCIAVKLGDELSDSPKRMTVAAERPAIVCRCSLALPP